MHNKFSYKFIYFLCIDCFYIPTNHNNKLCKRSIILVVYLIDLINLNYIYRVTTLDDIGNRWTYKILKKKENVYCEQSKLYLRI